MLSLTLIKCNFGKRASPTLGEQVLALADIKTQKEIASACEGARSNHVGVVGMGLANRETKNQAVVFYGHVEHDIPGALNPVIVSM